MNRAYDEFDKEQARQTGLSRLGRLKDRAKIYGSTALATYTGDMGRMANNAAIPYQQRDSGMGAPEYAKQAHAAAMETYKATGGNQFTKTVAGLRTFDQAMLASGEKVSALGTNARAAGMMLTSMGKLAAKLATDPMRATGYIRGGGLSQGAAGMWAGAKGIGGGLLGAMGGIPGLAIMGGMAGMQYASSLGDKRNQSIEDYGKSDMYSTLNAYREANGQATTPVTSMSAGAGASMATSAVVSDAKVAQKASDKDMLTFRDGSAPIRKYSGTPQQWAATARTIGDSKGFTTQEIEDLKKDFIRQPGSTKEQVNQALAALGPQSGAPSTLAPASDDVKDIVSATKSARYDSGMKNWAGYSGGWAGFAAQRLSTSSNSSNSWFGPGGGRPIETRSGNEIKADAEIGASIKAKHENQAGTFEGHYADQTRYKQENAAAAEAAKADDPAQLAALNKAFYTQELGADAAKNAPNVTADDIKQYGSWTEAARHMDSSGFGAKGGAYQATIDTGGRVTGKGGIPAIVKSGAVSDVLNDSAFGGTNKFFANLYNQNNKSVAAQAVQASDAHPDNAKLSSQGADAVVAAGQKLGMSMSEIMNHATQLASSLSGNAAEIALANQVVAKATLVQSQKNISISAVDQSQQKQHDIRGQISDLNKQPTLSVPQQATRNTLKQSLVDQQAEYANQLRSYLETHRAYEKSYQRAEDDFALQKQHSTDDFNRQEANAQVDFNTQKLHQQRDYNISIANMDADAAKSKMRTNRDFNLQLARQVEDAAKTMYNPYDRIQTASTWDTQNLVVNIQEQTDALRKQKSELVMLRKKGLSQQAIATLSLNDTNNGQQVDNLALDAQSNPGGIKALNAAVKDKGGAAGGLFNDSSNIALGRSKADFAKGLKDMGIDLATAQSRAAKSMSNAVSDQEAAFALARKRAGIEFGIGLDRSQEALGISLTHMTQDIHDADTSILGTLAQLSAAAGKTMAGQWGSFVPIMHNNAKDLIKAADAEATSAANDLAKSTVPKIQKSMMDIGITPADLFHISPAQMSANSKIQPLAWVTGTQQNYLSPSGMPISNHGATGGQIPGHSVHDKEDNIPIWATAGEFMHPVDSVQHYGLGAMEAIRSKRVPKEALAGYSLGGSVGGGGPVGAATVPLSMPNMPEQSKMPIPIKAFEDMAGKHSKLYEIIRDKVTMGVETKARNSIAMGGGNGMVAGGDSGAHGGNALANQAVASQMLHLFGWGQDQMASLVKLWNGESGWRQDASNGNSGPDSGTAYGIPQSLPGSKMASAGADWRTNPSTQIRWGLGYIKGRADYGSPDNAWRLWQSRSPHWYDQGGYLQPGQTGVNHTGSPEPVLTAPQWQSISDLTDAVSALITSEESKVLTGAGASHMTVNHHENITYDHRNDFGGANISVTSADPDDMARKLERKQVIKRVTQTRGVRR